jgi:glucoamylase
VTSLHHIWRFNHKCRTIPAGRTLRIEILARATVRWSADGWRTFADAATRDAGFGMHVADLPTGGLASGARIQFTFHWPEAGRWEGIDFDVAVA